MTMRLMVGHAHLTTHTSEMLFKKMRSYYDLMTKLYGGAYSDEFIIGEIWAGNIIEERPEYDDITTLPIPNSYGARYLVISGGAKFELEPNEKGLFYVVFDPEVKDEAREEYLKDI